MNLVYGEEIEYGLILLHTKEEFPDVGHCLFGSFPGSDPEKGIFTPNGSRFYIDRGHPEMATPECAHPHDLLLWSMANDLFLLGLKQEAENRFKRERRESCIEIFRNNTDNKTSFGCHENYMINRKIPIERIMHWLMPFLATRQLFCGTGSVWKDEAGCVHFEISQRARFMDQMKSATPTFNRGIISTRQDHENLADQNFRRLHLILADSNMSEISQYLRVGVTGLVLEMIERGFLDERAPVLKDTIQSLRRISAAVDPHVSLSLADGRSLTALDIQWWYAKRAEAFLEQNFDRIKYFTDMKELWEMWVDILEDLEQGRTTSLAQTVDWIIKKSFLDYVLAKHGRQWDDIDEEGYQELKEWDIRYHSIDTQGDREGLYNFLKRKGKIKTILDPELILWAKEHPPQNTRAFARGTLIREFPILSQFFSWDKLDLAKDQVFIFSDPLKTYEDLIEKVKNCSILRLNS
jgi:hypothetical protein